MDEDDYALSKLARTVVGTNDLDHRRASTAGWPRSSPRRRGPMAVTSRRRERDGDRRRGLDAEQEVPVLHLRLRKAAGARREDRRRASASHAPARRRRAPALARRGHERVRAAPASARAPGTRCSSSRSAALAARGTDGVVLAGEQLAGAAGGRPRLAREAGARFAYVTRRAGDRGALARRRAPLAPAGRPAVRRRRRASRGRGRLGADHGGRGRPRRARRSCTACADRRDRRPVRDRRRPAARPSRRRARPPCARRTSRRSSCKASSSATWRPSPRRSCRPLPVVERDGHLTDWEGRGQRVRPVRAPVGLGRPDWEIFARLALAMGGDLGVETLEELHEEMASLLAPREVRWSGPTCWAAPSAPPWLGPRAVHLPAARGRGPAVGGRGRAQGGAGGPGVRRDAPADTERAGWATATRSASRPTPARSPAPRCASPRTWRTGVVFVPFNQPGLAANTLLAGASTGPAAVEAVGDRRRAASDPDAALADGR